MDCLRYPEILNRIKDFKKASQFHKNEVPTYKPISLLFVYIPTRIKLTDDESLNFTSQAAAGSFGSFITLLGRLVEYVIKNRR
jgi:hypothetical protein